MLLSLAWRNLWRNARRTGTTVAAMTLAVVALIFYSGLTGGMLVNMESKVRDFGLGEAQVFAQNYRDAPSLYERIETPGTLVTRLQDAGYRAAPRLLGSGLGAGEDSSAGVSLVGVDLDLDRQVSRIHERVTRGAWLARDSHEIVVIGHRLARQLSLEPGSELIVLSQAADGSTANALFTVRGILGPISEEIDRAGVFMSDVAFRELMVMPTGAHQVLVRFPNATARTRDAEAAELSRLQALASGLDAPGWRQLNPGISSMLDNAQGSIFIMMSVVYLAIGIVILNAMLMAVFERIREFGVLKALGVGPGAVFRLIMLEAGMQASAAALMGSLIALPINAYMTTTGLRLAGSSGISTMGVSMDETWRSDVSALTYLGPVGLLFFFVLSAAVFPAIRAALTAPAQSMRAS